MPDRFALAQKTVFVATASDISSLAPELVRKGRKDESFFADLLSALRSARTCFAFTQSSAT